MWGQTLLLISTSISLFASSVYSALPKIHQHEHN